MHQQTVWFRPKAGLRLSMSDSSPGQQDAARIEWIEAATVGTYRTLEWPERLSAIALSPDRRWLAGALSDSRQVLLWELDSTNTKGPHNREQLDRAVDLLTSNDAKEARQAMASLIASGDRGVGMLAPLLKSIAHPEQTKKDIRRWIEDLDDDDFFVREKATGALNELGRIAVPELKAALENEPSAEAASRLKQLLKLSSKSRAVSGESLQRTRTIEILERSGSAQAFDVLEEVASGRKSSLEVSDARSIDFIEQRAPGQPAANAASTACAVDKSECWC